MFINKIRLCVGERAKCLWLVEFVCGGNIDATAKLIVSPHTIVNWDRQTAIMHEYRFQTKLNMKMEIVSYLCCCFSCRFNIKNTCEVVDNDCRRFWNVDSQRLAWSLSYICKTINSMRWSKIRIHCKLFGPVAIRQTHTRTHMHANKQRSAPKCTDFIAILTSIVQLNCWRISEIKWNEILHLSSCSPTPLRALEYIYCRNKSPTKRLICVRFVVSLSFCCFVSMHNRCYFEVMFTFSANFLVFIWILILFDCRLLDLNFSVQKLSVVFSFLFEFFRKEATLPTSPEFASTAKPNLVKTQFISFNSYYCFVQRMYNTTWSTQITYLILRLLKLKPNNKNWKIKTEIHSK